MTGHMRVRRGAGRAVIAAGLLALGGCGLFDEGAPERARVVVEGDVGAQVTLTISTEFVSGVTEENVTQVRLFGADTVTRTLPWDTIYDISRDQQFFITALDADSTPPQLRLQVFIDQQVTYDQTGILGERPFLFLYQFNKRRAVVVEVV